MNRIKATITVVLLVVLGTLFIVYFDSGIMLIDNDNNANDNVAELFCQPTSSPGTIVEYSDLNGDKKQIVRESIEGDVSPGLNNSQKNYFNPQKYIRYKNGTYNCQVVQW